MFSITAFLICLYLIANVDTIVGAQIYEVVTDTSIS